MNRWLVGFKSDVDIIINLTTGMGGESFWVDEEP